MTEDEMVGWHHRLDGHEFEQVPQVGDGQGGLVCCSPWSYKEQDMTGQLHDWTTELTDPGHQLLESTWLGRIVREDNPINSH